MRYAVKCPGNEEYMSIHLDRELPELASRYSTEKDSPAAKVLRAGLMAIPGIVEVYTHDRYRMTIRRGGAFLWSEIEPLVLEKIRLFFEETDAMTPVEAYQ